MKYELIVYEPPVLLWWERMMLIADPSDLEVWAEINLRILDRCIRFSSLRAGPS